MSQHPRVQLLVWCVLAGLGSAFALLIASGLGQPVTLSFGHGDREYTAGFRRGHGPEHLVTERWAQREASFWLPVRVVGPGSLHLEGSRPGLPAVRVEIRQRDRVVGQLSAGPTHQSHEFPIAAGSPARFELVTASQTGDRSLRLREVGIEPTRPFSLQPEPAILLRTALGAALLTAVLATQLGAAWAALSSSILIGLSLSVVASIDLFAGLYLARKVTLVGPLVVAAAGLVVRSRGNSLLIVAAGVLLRGGLVYQPAYGYQDVEIHRSVAVVAHDRGARELWRNMEQYQARYSLGEARVEGAFRPFPYPPTLHTIAGIGPRRGIVDVMKAVSIAAQAAVILLAMALARMLNASKAGVTVAGIAAAVAPSELRELLMASYPAILGHALDTALVVALLYRWEALRKPSGVILASLGVAACGLTYNASVVHLGLFLPLLLIAASLRPPLRGRLGLTTGAIAGGLLSLIYYGHYLAEILASVGKSFGAEGRVLSIAERVGLAFGDWLDVGWPLAITACVGLWLVLCDHWARPASRVVAAWAAYAVVISVPVLIVPEPFAYFRRLYFVFPLFFALAGYAAGRRDFFAAIFVLVLLAWNLSQIATFAVPYFITHSGSLAPA